MNNESCIGEAPVYESLTLTQVAGRLTARIPTLILFHARPDGDAVGSAFALRTLLCAMGMPAWCVCADEIPARLRFLMHGSQDSVLPDAIPADVDWSRVVSVDTASPAQLGALWERFCDKIDMMIDHHGAGTPYADGLIVPDAAGCAEIIFDLSRAWLCMGALSYIPAEADTCIYAGLNTDTGSFKYSNVTPKTHRCAAELHRAGVDSAAITQKLYGSKPYLQLKAEGAGIRSLTFFANGRIAAVRFPYELKQELGVADEHLETLVDMARGIEGVEVAISVRQPNEEPVFRCSTRANGTVDVSAVCAAFGGGGHVRAAGCTLTGFDSIDAAVAAVVAEIEKRL